MKYFNGEKKVRAKSLQASYENRTKRAIGFLISLSLLILPFLLYLSIFIFYGYWFMLTVTCSLVTFIGYKNWPHLSCIDSWHISIKGSYLHPCWYGYKDTTFHLFIFYYCYYILTFLPLIKVLFSYFYKKTHFLW